MVHLSGLSLGTYRCINCKYINLPYTNPAMVIPQVNPVLAPQPKPPAAQRPASTTQVPPSLQFKTHVNQLLGPTIPPKKPRRPKVPKEPETASDWYKVHLAYMRRFLPNTIVLPS